MAEVYEAEPEVNRLQASKLEAADQHTQIVSDDERPQSTCARDFWNGSSQGTWVRGLCRPGTREASKTDE